jgi:hypothetical protein
VNFFAHTVLAARRRDDLAWLIGSMAPDLASMGGLRLRRGPARGALAEGIAFHHRSDDAFHGAPIFLALQKEARIELVARDVGLGAAMGIGHVGVELLLDGCLVARHGVSPSFRAALGGAAAVADELDFRADDPVSARSRWRELCGRLVAAPVPERYREPAFVAERLIRILARRPRLAVSAGREPAVYAWAAEALPRVDAQVDSLLEQVEARLGDDDRPYPRSARAT